MERKVNSDGQIGGNHYKDFAITPIEYILKNNLGFAEGNVVKYISRYDKKGTPVEDLKKAKDYVELLLAHYEEKEKLEKINQEISKQKENGVWCLDADSNELINPKEWSNERKLGGIVLIMSKYRLVINPTLSAPCPWGNPYVEIVHELGGEPTNDIISSHYGTEYNTEDLHFEGAPAAEYCQIAGFDYKLPTVEELQIIADYIDAINEALVIAGCEEFPLYHYLWTCKESDSNGVYAVELSGAHPRIFPKTYSLKTLVIRNFEK